MSFVANWDFGGPFSPNAVFHLSQTNALEPKKYFLNIIKIFGPKAFV
jgi:hypothetical protein